VQGPPNTLQLEIAEMIGGLLGMGISGMSRVWAVCPPHPEHVEAFKLSMAARERYAAGDAAGARAFALECVKKDPSASACLAMLTNASHWSPRVKGRPLPRTPMGALMPPKVGNFPRPTLGDFPLPPE
jgi:hypothetical protein